MDDDLLDPSTLAGRLGACLVAGFVVAALPVVWVLLTDSAPATTGHVDGRTALEAWGLVIGFAGWAVSSLAVLLHWIFVREPTYTYESYYSEEMRRSLGI